MLSLIKKMAYSKLGGIGLPIFKHFRTEQKGVGKYIPCSGSGIAIPTDNNYLETLAKIAADSPTHGGAIDKKGRLTFGQGWETEGLPEKVLTLFKDMNEDDETANEILERVSYDNATFSGYAFRVRWTGLKTIGEIEHVPFKGVRIGELEGGKITHFIYSNDWENLLDPANRIVYRINKFDPSKITEAKMVGNEAVNDDTSKENAWQLVYCKRYSPADSGLYPVPDYAPCLDAAIGEVETGIAMRNGYANGIDGATIVTSKGETPLDDDSKKMVTEQLDATASGGANAKSIIWIPAHLQIDQLKGIDADTYVEANKEFRQRIITGHTIPAILLEVSLSGGFNNRAEEMKAAINQFQATNILSYQQRIIRSFMKVLKFVDDGDYDLMIKPFLDPETSDEETDESDDEKVVTKEDTATEE